MIFCENIFDYLCECFGIDKYCIVLKGILNSVSKIVIEIGICSILFLVSLVVSLRRRKENRY